MNIKGIFTTSFFVIFVMLILVMYSIDVFDTVHIKRVLSMASLEENDKQYQLSYEDFNMALNSSLERLQEYTLKQKEITESLELIQKQNQNQNHQSSPSSLKPTSFNCLHRSENIECTQSCDSSPENWSEEGPDLCEFMNLKNIHKFNILLGFHSNKMTRNTGMFALSHADFVVMNYVFDHYHLNNMTELGTASGVSSLYFGLMCRTRKGIFHTFDYRDIRHPDVVTGWLDNMIFFQEDVLSTENQVVIDSIKRGGAQYVFMDNGNKIKEINTYAKHMSVNSILITHDWNNEIALKDISDALNSLNFSPIFHNVANIFKAHVRAWIRVSSGKIEE